MSIGFNIKRIREIKGLKQDFIADKLGISQQAYSKIEQSDNLEEQKIKQIADILEIIPEAIHNFNEAAVFNNFNNNSHVINYQLNPLEKIIELYEKLLQEKEKLITTLNDKIKN